MYRLFVSLVTALMLLAAPSQAQTSPSEAKEAYSALHQFELNGGSGAVSNLVLKRDRAEMTFTGTFYFPQPVMGKITGAVFIGQGKFRAEPPPSLFERDNLQRMLKTNVVEADFQTAVLRFSDDTHKVIGQTHEPRGTAPKEAQDLATQFEARMLKESGANIASRLLLSLLHNEAPGFFMAQFDKGSRGRFTFLFDPQGRIPTANFGINGGEKGLIYAYNKNSNSHDIWLAFYSLDDYQRGRVNYSDAFDLVETPHYWLRVDLREPRKILRLSARLDLTALMDGVRGIPFNLTESLPEYDEMRLKKGMKVKSLRRSDGTALEWIQEDWEGGFTVLLPSPLKTGEKVTLEAEMEGDFIYDRGDTFDCHFPFVNSEWYPRHGYLGRSFFDLEYLHPKRYKVASAGTRVKEEPWAENKDYVLTTYKLEKPVALVTFAMGPYEIHKENLKLSAGGELPVEFYSMPGGALAIKEDFIVAEMKNGINYFSALFGAYPYPVFRAAFHPFGFGQGFATMLVIPPTDRASKYVYSFISHETGHQWWGNIVGWRSYRDQWLSEGFAEYSGVLYTQRRQNPGAARELLVEMRDSLKEPPETETGIGAGKLTDIGPLILGLRLSTRESRNAYGTLVYNKGGLVLRMLHFLFTDPVTGNGEPFFEMMRDFVNRNRNGWATTEGFMEVANEHFARTPIAQKYGITNLNWFFRQWVWQTHLPSYRLEYTFEIMPDGKVQLRGTLFQENTPQNWVMPLPLVFKFGGNQVARGTVLANGPQSPVAIALPQRPDSVELDPEMWVLSEKTQTKKR
jgi:hypothetical protein